MKYAICLALTFAVAGSVSAQTCPCPNCPTVTKKVFVPVPAVMPLPMATKTVTTVTNVVAAPVKATVHVVRQSPVQTYLANHQPVRSLLRLFAPCR